MSETPELLRVPEAAALLSISRSKTYALVKEGVLPSIIIGETIRIPRQALIDWIEAHTTMPKDYRPPGR